MFPFGLEAWYWLSGSVLPQAPPKLNVASCLLPVEASQVCHPEVGLLPQQAQLVCPTPCTTAPSPVSSAWELTPFTEPGWHTPPGSLPVSRPFPDLLSV